MKLTEYAVKWLTDYKDGIIKPATMKNYRYAIKYADMVLGDMNIEDIKTLDLKRAFVELCEKGYSKSTIRITKRVLTQVFNQAIQDNLIINNPVTKAEMPHNASEKHVDSYTDNEWNAIVEAALEDVQGDPIIFLMYTGLRRAELINLKWNDYNARDSVIYIRSSKTDNGIREVFLSRNAEFILKRQPRYGHGHIFSTTKGLPISATSLKKTYKRLRKVTGNNEITLHRCRHSFCSRLSDRGVSPKIIAELAGHSNVSFTMQRYVHPSRKLKMDAVNLLDD